MFNYSQFDNTNNNRNKMTIIVFIILIILIIISIILNNKNFSISKKQLEEIEYLKEDKKREIKEKVSNLIKSYIPNYDLQFDLINDYFHINLLKQECLKDLIEINNEELFNKSTVSFNYLDKNPKNNKYYNKSKYLETINSYNINYNKYYDTYSNNTNYSYYEFIIENSLTLNNLNLNKINLYKEKCNVPSSNIKIPIILSSYNIANSYYKKFIYEEILLLEANKE